MKFFNKFYLYCTLLLIVSTDLFIIIQSKHISLIYSHSHFFISIFFFISFIYLFYFTLLFYTFLFFFSGIGNVYSIHLPASSVLVSENFTSKIVEASELNSFTSCRLGKITQVLRYNTQNAFHSLIAVGSF